MNLNLTGVHLDVTPAIRAYVVAKMDRVNRHFDHVIDVNVILSVDKLRQKCEANVHVRGKEIHAESIDPDMYAAIDSLADKLDRQVLKYKEKASAHRTDRETIERTLAATLPPGAPAE
jgi:putative sigma-54 modulation protein